MNKEETIGQLQEENKKLQKELKFAKKQINIKDEIVIQQSKMASMGEMINNIAHQWRQPLMEIASLLMKIEVKIKLEGQIDQIDLLETIEKSNEVLKFMSNTIDDFRNFFATDKKKESFFIAHQISSMLSIMKTTLSVNKIKVDIILKDNIKINGYKNEYSQVLLNIISNAKDALVSNKIKNPKIIIRLYKREDGKSVLEIEDNGGGIPFSPLDKVFEPFFTYKKKNGTGIGLFMSKLIIENNMNGELKVKNSMKGACFSIII
jgi:signal transduction histidine kinase